MTARQKTVLALGAVLSLIFVGAPASANHSMNFSCADPSPSTSGANADVTCSFTTHRAGANVQTFRIDFPPGTWINEDENGPGGGDGVTDPADGDQVGTLTMATDLSYDGCGDANDGGTYNMYWRSHPNWTSYSVPSGWTKTAEFRAEFRVLFFFTEQVPIHIIKNDSTGNYAAVGIVPSARGCTGAVSDWQITIFGYVNQDSSAPCVTKNPASAGTHTVTLTVTYTDNSTDTDSDTITTT